MALTTLLLNQQGGSEGVVGITVDGFFEQSVPFDNVMREEHSFLDRVTEHPIEDGADITDHVVEGLQQLVMEGHVSDAPLQLVQGVASAIEGGSSRSTRAWSVLKQFRGKIITAITGLDRIESALVTALSASRTGTSGNALHFTMRVKEANIVNSVIVAFPNSATGRGTSQQNRGKQSADAPDEAVEDKASLLVQGLKGLGVLK